ncbi:type VI secretion system tip protein VgrG [Pseudomonas synxantha]|uniref:Type VI secretion system secreted protein VgrG n=1 Tax=Pseudomonas synxantha TaxID=47883 RepID=A0ACC6JNU4_9PSED|nr:type VI secretion system tip protein VgrG [Pseudomonas synxantha]MDR6608036.1 type VI secretion system secreted protein VgrG [Pseudomonas synxantha]
MFAPANQSRFTLSLEGDPDHDFKVLEFTGKEAISQPYRFELELVSERASIPLESLLHRQAFLRFDGHGCGIHGQIFRVGQGESGRRLTRYQISLVPRLTYLGRRINQRIFQHKPVPQIIAQVLEDHGILEHLHFKFLLSGQYPEREYCVQYAESDLAFIQRLCAEIGIHYHFQHSPDGHLLMFGDDQTIFPRLTEPSMYLPGSGMAAETPVIKRFDVNLQAGTTLVTRRDYDFHKPRLLLESGVDNKQQPVLEDYHFPGQFTDRKTGSHLAQRALERHNVDSCQAEGGSDDSALVSGHFLRLAEHPHETWNDLWLITQIEHRGRQPQVLEESAPSDADNFQGYRNTFLATPWDVFYRPPLIEKPHASGYHCAVVTGPKGSEIHCDEYGRVKVRMKWDRHGELNDHSSCWLRVATGWAHDRYGSVLIPRVGMEVLVGFMHGDADKPLVMACAPNASTSPPLNLPADKTRSIFRSQSSPGGGGYNELRIEDRKGAEEVYLRAQRDWNQDVLQDMHVQVGSQRSVIIGSAEGQASSDSLHVHGDLKVRVINHALGASGQVHVSAGQQIVIDGGVNTSIQSGGHWINIGPAGIFSSVPIQVGGAPMPTMGTSAVQRKPEALSFAQVLSLKSDAPFCEECARCKEGVCAA